MNQLCDFKYTQPDGFLYQFPPQAAEPDRLTQAYSGKDKGMNDPAWEHIAGVGVIPAGSYTIVAVDFKTHPEWHHMGPVIFQLLPDVSNKMYGRSAFFIHWGMADYTMRASEGCIIIEYQWVFDRITVAVKDGRNRLLVTPLTVSYPPPTPKPTVT